MNTHYSLACRIALAQAKYIGPHNARLILEQIPSIEELFADPAYLGKVFPHCKQRIINELKRPTLLDEAKRLADLCLRNGIRTYFIGDEDYPQRLSHCCDAPILLYVQGDYSAWDTPLSLSVVGTRNITPYGQATTDRLLSEIASLSNQALIVSGLAYGVDIAAHRKALALGLPTIAVLAHGFDRIYPAVHRQTALEILEHGAWVSEYPPGASFDRYSFVARNRIIAGLSDATLVIEAGLRSGSLITADLAAGYDREVLAVPGRINDTYSEGCNQLIASLKAVLATSGKDILTALGIEPQTNTIQQTLQFEPTISIEHPLLHLIAQHQPIHLNDLASKSSLPLQELRTQLLDLELDGHIATMPGGLYILAT